MDTVRKGPISQKLAEYFSPGSSRAVYTDIEIREISLLLKEVDPAWSTVPRLYIVLRVLNRVDLLNDFLSLGFTDHWFPMARGALPKKFNPNLQAQILETQKLILTKSTDLEKGEQGEHRHFGKDEPLPFTTVKKLGGGGYGEVHQVVSTISGKQYARKRIRRKTAFGQGLKAASEGMKLFLAEMNIMKRLNHHHIVQYIGSYTDPVHLVLLMEPVCDMNLAQYLSSFSPAQKGVLRTFFGCLLKALQYLHDKDIRHRDVKPQNILVRLSTESVLLTDFGLSKDYSNLTGSTTSGPTARSLRYCAPEVADHDFRNSSSDIWSLGCVFLEMCTVLKGSTISDMNVFFSSRGDGGAYVSANEAAASLFIHQLKASGDAMDNTLLYAIEPMINRDRSKRPTAKDVFDTLIGLDHMDSNARRFCGSCCLDSDGFDSSEEDELEDNYGDRTIPNVKENLFFQQESKTAYAAANHEWGYFHPGRSLHFSEEVLDLETTLPKSSSGMTPRVLDKTDPFWQSLIQELIDMGLTEDQIDENAEFIETYAKQQKEEEKRSAQNNADKRKASRPPPPPPPAQRKNIETPHEGQHIPSSSPNLNIEKNCPKPDLAHVRRWGYRSGSFAVHGSFLDLKDNKVHIHKLNGVKIAVPIEKLSEEDIEYAETKLKLKVKDKRAGYSTEPEHSENAGYSTEPGSGLQNQVTVRPWATKGMVKAARARFEDASPSQSHQSTPKPFIIPTSRSMVLAERAREAQQHAQSPSLSDTYLHGLQHDIAPCPHIPPCTNDSRSLHLHQPAAGPTPHIKPYDLSFYANPSRLQSPIDAPRESSPHTESYSGRVNLSYGEMPFDPWRPLDETPSNPWPPLNELPDSRTWLYSLNDNDSKTLPEHYSNQMPPAG